MTNALVIGAGHNGLTTAALLAKKGINTTVLEASPHVGGMAADREFAPGFRAPGCALFVYQLQSEVVAALKLEQHGLSVASNALSTVALGEEGQHIKYSEQTLTGSGLSQNDVSAYSAFAAQMRTFGRTLAKFNNQKPPKLGYGELGDKVGLARLALDVRRLGRDDMRELLRVGASNIYDVLDEWFDHEGLKGALALDAVLGTHLGPRSGNSMLTYLHRLSGSYGSLVQARVGEGSVANVFAKATRSNGVDIRTNARVERVVVRNGRAAGVILKSGETLTADIVVSNADPRTTVMSLVGARHFDTGFVRRIHHVRMRGNAVRLNLALSARPDISGLSIADYGQRLLIAPSVDRVERAFNPAKYGEWSKEAVMEMSLPSEAQPELAPNGKHILSATVQYAPYDLKQGWSADSKRRLTDQLIRQLEERMPGITDSVEASELLSPVDIERLYGTSGGHWHHGELTLDQFMFVRPTYGAAQYAMPLDGLYLCGAGAHPGGGLSGAAGRNCALEIIRREGQS